jgi:hypothetical protein
MDSGAPQNNTDEITENANSFVFTMGGSSLPLDDLHRSTGTEQDFWHRSVDVLCLCFDARIAADARSFRPCTAKNSGCSSSPVCDYAGRR